MRIWEVDVSVIWYSVSHTCLLRFNYFFVGNFKKVYDTCRTYVARVSVSDAGTHFLIGMSTLYSPKLKNCSKFQMSHNQNLSQAHKMKKSKMEMKLNLLFYRHNGSQLQQPKFIIRSKITSNGSNKISNL